MLKCLLFKLLVVVLNSYLVCIHLHVDLEELYVGLS